MEPKIERRFVPMCEIRADAADGKPKQIVGHVAMFNVRTPIWDFEEEIAPGAFAETAKTDDIRALFNHDPNLVLGRSASKTARFWEDDKGLRMEADPPDTQVGRDMLTLIARGDVSGASFGFQVLDEEWRSETGKPDVRTLKKVKLFDAGPVTFPAYQQPQVDVRSHEAYRKELEKPPVVPTPPPAQTPIVVTPDDARQRMAELVK